MVVSWRLIILASSALLNHTQSVLIIDQFSVLTVLLRYSSNNNWGNIWIWLNKAMGRNNLTRFSWYFTSWTLSNPNLQQLKVTIISGPDSNAVPIKIIPWINTLASSIIQPSSPIDSSNANNPLHNTFRNIIYCSYNTWEARHPKDNVWSTPSS